MYRYLLSDPSLYMQTPGTLWTESAFRSGRNC